MYKDGEYAIVGSMGSPGNIFEQSWYLRGLTEFFLDLVDNKEFAHALMSKITGIRKQNAEYFLREVGDYLDVFQLADDLAMQNGPYMSPDLYREMIKPYQLELFQFVKSLTSAKIYYHSCGSITRLLDDLIEVGVDILNPVQVTAEGMETDLLKRRFGTSLSFWGAIDTTQILPNGTADDVRKEVKKIIHDLAPGGGFVLSSVHNLQPDIPPENILAMFEAASQYGRYPIQQ
jgi:uroporphyrinogen decarboxylase